MLIHFTRRLGVTALARRCAPAPLLAGRRLCSGTPSSEPPARIFLRERGYSDQVAEGVLKELHRNWGVAPGGEMQMVTALAGAWEVGADAGLAALANAVERELAVAEDRPVVKFYVNPPGGHAVPPIACEGFEGMSLRDVIEHGEGDGAGLLREMLECACSGVMACSTCHVYVEPSWLSRVGEPEEDEQARPDDAMAARYSDQPLQGCPRARPLPDPLCVRPASQDMLDLAHEPRDNSRLGCQLVLRPELEGLVISVPKGANNLFDHIPFD